MKKILNFIIKYQYLLIAVIFITAVILVFSLEVKPEQKGLIFSTSDIITPSPVLSPIPTPTPESVKIKEVIVENQPTVSEPTRKWYEEGGEKFYLTEEEYQAGQQEKAKWAAMNESLEKSTADYQTQKAALDKRMEAQRIQDAADLEAQSQHNLRDIYNSIPDAIPVVDCGSHAFENKKQNNLNCATTTESGGGISTHN